jgi:hypothetical protein
MFQLFHHCPRMSEPFLIIYIKPYFASEVINTMFDYMRARNGNIIVVDKKKESIVRYIKEYQKISHL